jgi:hypothetical protein
MKSRRAGSPRGESDATPVLTRRRRFVQALHRTLLGLALALGVYLLTNPYILINAFVNRDVLRSNFANSLAMYEIARIGEGLVRVIELTIEGATLPVVVVGLVGLLIAVVRRNQAAVPLVVVAGVFLLQFVLIGAGKPAEYGRFGIFTNTAFAMGAGSILAYRVRRSRWINSVVGLAVLGVTVWTVVVGGHYLGNFHVDAHGTGTRQGLAEFFRTKVGSDQCPVVVVGVPHDPAPYCLPPMNFSNVKLLLANDGESLLSEPGDCRYFIAALDRVVWPRLEETVERLGFLIAKGPSTPISWANKPIRVTFPGRPMAPGAFGD